MMIFLGAVAITVTDAVAETAPSNDTNALHYGTFVLSTVISVFVHWGVRTEKLTLVKHDALHVASDSCKEATRTHNRRAIKETLCDNPSPIKNKDNGTAIILQIVFQFLPETPSKSPPML